MELPRFFLPSAHDVDGPEAPPGEPVHVIDRLVHVRDGAPVERLVGLDSLGALVAHDVDHREALLGSIRAHLAHAEVQSARVRRVETAPGGLWLMAIELLEQLPDAPGPNDPVYLYGTLWPADDPLVAGRRGQLTTTRGDVLRGLVEGLAWAFRYPPDEGERVPRAFHLALPGDRAEVVRGGRGIVLADPATEPALLGAHASNEIQALHLYHDVLAALRGDADHDGDAGGPLPVPDLTGFVKDLVDQGWTIADDQRSATREAPAAGFFKRLFGGRESVELPAPANVEDYARRARAELARLDAWPTPSSEALFTRVGPWSGALGGSSRTIPAARASSPLPAATSAEPAPRPAPRPIGAAAPRASRDEWMRDFVIEHAPRHPRLTPVRPPPPPAPLSRPAERGRPDWMKDFD
ncbi:MAG: hypothetical protein IT385_21950 [Deltaproteobacteria bacterium]|nr:hypothetical protein [Deltaproteobacteria bacterium]